MNEPRPSSPPPPYATDPYYEDEIELMDILRVIWKWKRLIILGTIFCAVAAGVISFLLPKVYSIDMVIRPGILRVLQDGKNIYIESAENLKAIIDAGTFDNRILSNLAQVDGEDLPHELDFKVTIPKKSNAVKVSFETSDLAQGLDIMRELQTGLLARYADLVGYYQKEDQMRIESKSKETVLLGNRIAKINSDISTLDAETAAKVQQTANQIASLRAEISAVEAARKSELEQLTSRIRALKADIAAAVSKSNVEERNTLGRIATAKAERVSRQNQIKNLEQRLADLKEEIDRISKNTDQLIEERNRFLAGSAGSNDALSALIYGNTIQQNISYVNQLRSTINNVNHQIYQEILGIERVENAIVDFQAELENVTKQREAKIEKLQSEIKELESQKENVQKQLASEVDKLKSQISDLETEKEKLVKQAKYEIQKLKAEISDLESERGYIQEEIKNLRFKKDSIQNIQVLQQPTPGPFPVKPKKKLYVALATVLGLFLTLLLSFLVEYISKHKEELGSP